MPLSDNEDETSGSDTDVSTYDNMYDNTSQRSPNESTSDKPQAKSFSSEAPTSATPNQATSAIDQKEIERKERRRDAVRQCRRRKREAAMRLEAQFKYERERQARLVSELEKKSLTVYPAPAPPRPVHPASEAEIIRALFQSGALHGQIGVPDYSQQRLAQAAQVGRMHLEQQAVLLHSLQSQQQPFLGGQSVLRAKLNNEGGHLTIMQEMLMRRSAEAAAAQAAKRAPMPSPALLGPMAALLAAAEQEERRSLSPPHTPPLTNFTNPSLMSKPRLFEQNQEEGPPRLVKKQKLDTNLTEDEKELRRKERKREAVRRCRQRKRLQQQRLAEETVKIVHQNERLQSSLVSNGMHSMNPSSTFWKTL